MFRLRQFHVGDWVVYSVSKRSTHPGPRARDIRPEPCGEGYYYLVDKYWVVQEVRDATVVLMTRRGKLHEVDASDPNLHPASWWERLFHSGMFPKRPTQQGQPNYN